MATVEYEAEQPQRIETPELTPEAQQELKQRIQDFFSTTDDLLAIHKIIFKYFGVASSQGLRVEYDGQFPLVFPELRLLNSLSSTPGPERRKRARGSHFLTLIFAHQIIEKPELAALKEMLSPLFRPFSDSFQYRLKDEAWVDEVTTFIGDQSYNLMKEEGWEREYVKAFVEGIIEAGNTSYAGRVGEMATELLIAMLNRFDSALQSYDKTLMGLIEQSPRGNTPPISTTEVSVFLQASSVFDREVLKVMSKRALSLIRFIGESVNNTEEDETSIILRQSCTEILEGITAAPDRGHVNYRADRFKQAARLLKDCSTAIYVVEDAMRSLLEVNNQAKETLFSRSYKGSFLTMLPVKDSPGSTSEERTRLTGININAPSTSHLCARLSREVLKLNSGIPGSPANASKPFMTRRATSVHFPLVSMGRTGALTIKVQTSLNIPSSCRRGDRTESHDLVSTYVHRVVRRYLSFVNKDLESTGLSLGYTIEGLHDLTNRDSQIALTTQYRRALNLRAREKATKERVLGCCDRLFMSIPWYYFRPTGTIANGMKRKAVFTLYFSLCVDEGMYSGNVLPDSMSPEEREQWIREKVVAPLESGRHSSVLMTDGFDPSEEADKLIQSSSSFNAGGSTLERRNVFPVNNFRGALLNPSNVCLLQRQTKEVLGVVPKLIDIYNTFTRRKLRGLRKVEF